MIRTPEGKWILFDAATGEQAEFWPIDGTAMMQAGSHVAEAPEGTVVKLPKQPPRHPGPPQMAPVQTFVGEGGDAPPTKPAKPKA